MIFFTALTEAGKVGGSLATEFFREEYTLNHYTGTYHSKLMGVVQEIRYFMGVFQEWIDGLFQLII